MNDFKKESTFYYIRYTPKLFLGCMWHHHFLKSKILTKKPPKLLPSSGLRGGKFISVYNFSAQEHALS